MLNEGVYFWRHGIFDDVEQFSPEQFAKWPLYTELHRRSNSIFAFGMRGFHWSCYVVGRMQARLWFSKEPC